MRGVPIGLHDGPADPAMICEHGKQDGERSLFIASEGKGL